MNHLYDKKVSIECLNVSANYSPLSRVFISFFPKSAVRSCEVRGVLVF